MFGTSFLRHGYGQRKWSSKTQFIGPQGVMILVILDLSVVKAPVSVNCLFNQGAQQYFTRLVLVVLESLWFHIMIILQCKLNQPLIVCYMAFIWVLWLFLHISCFLNQTLSTCHILIALRSIVHVTLEFNSSNVFWKSVLCGLSVIMQ